MLPLLVFHLRSWGGAAWLFGFRWYVISEAARPSC